MAAERHCKAKGEGESQTFSSDLVDFMELVRDGEHFLITAHLVTWVKFYQPQWLSASMADKSNNDRAYKSLVQWCLRFANCHGLSHRPNYMPSSSTPKRAWINVDETPVYYDMPQGRTKMPLLIIVKGTQGASVWLLYLREVLHPEMDCPSVVLADNFTCHMSKKSYKILEDELFCSAYL
ncbi:hypothetical protein B5M09_010570 [Aphanomyces astaci]|uniref:DDE-1 domain-containing protein n=1 Tax=Aphanomyces astaci TaxID=112090 RepID=A0A3R7ZDE6_APHAT|nr:hypothetical protein B5M09_010570 [Aphanomyces astaci]